MLKNIYNPCISFLFNIIFLKKKNKKKIFFFLKKNDKFLKLSTKEIITVFISQEIPWLNGNIVNE